MLTLLALLLMGALIAAFAHALGKANARLEAAERLVEVMFTIAIRDPAFAVEDQRELARKLEAIFPSLGAPVSPPGR